MRFIMYIRQQAEKLEWFGEGFSKASRLEAGVMKMRPVFPALLKAIDQVSLKAEEKGINICLKGRQDIEAFCDTKWTEEAFYNLLQGYF